MSPLWKQTTDLGGHPTSEVIRITKTVLACTPTYDRYQHPVSLDDALSHVTEHLLKHEIPEGTTLSTAIRRFLFQFRHEEWRQRQTAKRASQDDKVPLHYEETGEECFGTPDQPIDFLALENYRNSLPTLHKIFVDHYLKYGTFKNLFITRQGKKLSRARRHEFLATFPLFSTLEKGCGRTYKAHHGTLPEVCIESAPFSKELPR